jgi:hypothetical protein
VGTGFAMHSIQDGRIDVSTNESIRSITSGGEGGMRSRAASGDGAGESVTRGVRCEAISQGTCPRGGAGCRRRLWRRRRGWRDRRHDHRRYGCRDHAGRHVRCSAAVGRDRRLRPAQGVLRGDVGVLPLLPGSDAHVVRPERPGLDASGPRPGCGGAGDLCGRSHVRVFTIRDGVIVRTAVRRRRDHGAGLHPRLRADGDA